MLTTSRETARDVYNKSVDWIIDYDSDEIDEAFK